MKDHTVDIIKNDYGYYEVKNKPSELELQQYYSEKYYQNEKGNYSHFYNESELEYFRNKIEQKFWIIESLLNCKNTTTNNLIDIGCGEGFTLKYFHEKKWNVTGLDYSDFGCKNINPTMLEYINTGDIYNSLIKLIEDKKTFDVIWLSNILEHVIDPYKLLQHCKELSNQQTVLVIQVPNDFSVLQNFLLDKNKIDKKFWIAYPDHLSYFNNKGLTNLCVAAGWNAEKMITDFPIDLFLMNDSSNYIVDKTKGKNAYQSRIDFENLFHVKAGNQINELYQKMAEVGLGRQITGFYKLNK